MLTGLYLFFFTDMTKPTEQQWLAKFLKCSETTNLMRRTSTKTDTVDPVVSLLDVFSFFFF